MQCDCPYACMVEHCSRRHAQVSLATLAEAGEALETAFSPLVLLVHVAMCGAGAALAQISCQTSAVGISGTGVAAGLVVSLLVHQVRSGLPPRPTPTATWMLVLAPLLALHQPVLGIWCAGGGRADHK